MSRGIVQSILLDKEHEICRNHRKCGYVGNLFYMKVWRSLWEKWLVNCGKGVFAFPWFINTLSIAYPCWNAGYPYIHALMIICKMLEMYFVEYFVEYFTEKRLLFTKKRVLFWKKNDIEKASKINNSLNLLAFEVSRQRESNPPPQLGKLIYYRCTMSAKHILLL